MALNHAYCACYVSNVSLAIFQLFSNPAKGVDCIWKVGGAIYAQLKSRVIGATTDKGDHKPGNPGVLMDFYEHGKLGEFCATSWKLLANKTSFSSIKYLCNTRSCA